MLANNKKRLKLSIGVNRIRKWKKDKQYNNQKDRDKHRSPKQCTQY